MIKKPKPNYLIKKLIALIIFILTCFSVDAQNEKGTFQIGAGGVPIIHPDGSFPTRYALRANVGYFLTDRISVGIMPFHGYVVFMKSTGANLYARYYFIDKKISFFAEGTTGFGSARYNNSKLNGTTFSYALGPGVDISLNNKISIEMVFQFARLKNINYPERTQVDNTIISNIGIQYYFRK